MRIDHTEEVWQVIDDFKVYRFLFSNGETQDVRAPRCDSDLREAVLKATGFEKIEGVACIEPEP